VSLWSVLPLKQPFEPWACTHRATGGMIWFASNLTDSKTIEHKFACDTCGEVERMRVPFVAPEPQE
jgi:hypothetical protein